MGSATREALARSRAALAELGRFDLQTAEDLLASERSIAAFPKLHSALVDPEADASRKRALILSVFGTKISNDAAELLTAAASHRWSSGDDFLAAIEELGYRVAAESTQNGVSLDDELFTFERLVASNPELEFALGSKLSPMEAKTKLVDRLLTERAAPQVVAIIRHLVQQPRGRRIGEMLRHAASVVADQLGFDVVTVTTAVPFTAEQLTRLGQSLAEEHTGPSDFNMIVDLLLLGGARIQMGDDIIDGSVAGRLGSLRQKLAA